MSSSHQSQSGRYGVQKNFLPIQRIETRFFCLPFHIPVSTDCTLTAYALNKHANKARGNILQLNEREGVLKLTCKWPEILRAPQSTCCQCHSRNRELQGVCTEERTNDRPSTSPYKLIYRGVQKTVQW